uniref:Glutathione S-transferase A-like n=1 Tax=Pundamilia nyererei TaxID=303518 RepID=A0A3B4EQI2_9CICH
MAKDMTLLWGTGSCPCWRVMIALEEKSLQGYNHKLLSFEKMEHKSQEVLDINPRGQVGRRGLTDKEVQENTSGHALLHLIGRTFLVNGPAEQALMYQRMFEGLTFYEKLNAVIYYDWYVPEGERHESALKRNKEALVTELKLWESYLQKVCSYLAGPSFTLADVVVFPTVERYPKLGEYYNLLKERPSVKASWPPHWLENPKGQDALKDI